MKLIVVLACFLSIGVQADVTQDEVTINGVRYEKEILYDNLDSQIYGPENLVMDYQTNHLYFNTRKYKPVSQYNAAKLNVNTKEFKQIEGTHFFNGGAAIDPSTHDVYVGAIDGIYKYHESTNKVHKVGGTNGDYNIIWNMFFKNMLYFVSNSDNLYTFVNGQSARFDDVTSQVHNFVIDNDDVMYFSHYTHFYMKRKYGDTVEINDVPYVSALNTDKNGNVYACSFDGIYKAIGHSAQFIKVVDSVDATGIAFDRDNNMIYSEGRKIIRLKPKGEYYTPKRIFAITNRNRDLEGISVTNK